MKKNFLRIIVAITTTLSLLAACGGNATNNAQATNANTNETKVEVIYHGNNKINSSEINKYILSAL